MLAQTRAEAPEATPDLDCPCVPDPKHPKDPRLGLHPLVLQTWQFEKDLHGGLFPLRNEKRATWCNALLAASQGQLSEVNIPTHLLLPRPLGRTKLNLESLGALGRGGLSLEKLWELTILDYEMQGDEETLRPWPWQRAPVSGLHSMRCSCAPEDIAWGDEEIV